MTLVARRGGVMERFEDRRAVGRLLGYQLRQLADEHPLILALPRGGVPVGFEVARLLRAPLYVWVVRKLGMPGNPEVGMGAVSEGGYVYLNPELVRRAGASQHDLERQIAEKRREVEARVRLFETDQARPSLRGREVIVVDDGIATGGTVAATLGAVRREGARKVILAVPVAAADTLEQLEKYADQITCLAAPQPLHAIGQWYDHFEQVEDEEVLALLAAARRFAPEPEARLTPKSARVDRAPALDQFDGGEPGVQAR